MEKNPVFTIYTGPLLENYQALYFLKNILTGERDSTKHLWNMFQGVSGETPLYFLKVTHNPALADFFLLPYSYFSFVGRGGSEARAFVANLSLLAEQYKKKLLIFCMDDSDDHIPVSNSIIFRYSQYGYKKRDNEIITPPYPLHFRSSGLEQWREKVFKNITPREKKELPVVGFCGWAGFPSIYRWATYQLRILLADTRQYIFSDIHAELHKNGIYFRRKALRALTGASGIKTNFLIRKSYSAQKGIDGKNTVKPEDAEKEYIENIINSDFVLAPKGHGNASVRFFESLALGRFPVLINTDCELPLRDYIDYKKFVVTVDHTHVNDAEQAILDFYNSLSNEEFQKRQQLARDAFLLLRPGSFLKITLSELKKKQLGSR